MMMQRNMNQVWKTASSVASLVDGQTTVVLRESCPEPDTLGAPPG